MSRWFAAGLVLVVLGALALRLPLLDQRPMHCDEAVHATKFLGLWKQGVYRYDPNEFHGPVLYYATLPLAWLSSAQEPRQLRESALRSVAVLFGVGLILLLPLAADGLGRLAALCAAVLTALSPGMVYYSRYYIHELLLVFFSFLALAAFWRYWRSPRLGWALTIGGALGLAHTTKETCVFVFAALGGAAALGLLWQRRVTGAWPDHRRWKHASHWAAALGVAVLVSATFFSSFSANAQGPLDSLRTYLPWLTRAGGQSPHNHPWYFYLERLACFHQGKGPVWSEALVLGLALVGLIAGLRGKDWGEGHAPFVRFLGFYALLLTLIYCGIPYKTPWCLLGFYHALILLAGVGAAWALRQAKRGWLRICVAAALALAAGQLGWQAWRTSFRYAADPRNPWVYAHTLPDILRMVEKVEGIAKVYPGPSPLVVKVMASGGDYWPLPWYLRGFKDVGWWDRVPPDPFAPIVIAGAKLEAALDEKSDKRWLSVGYHQLRPKVFVELFVQFDLWKSYLESLPPRRDDED